MKLARRAARAISHFTELAENGPTKECPVCGYVGPFSPVRHKPSIWCPKCDSRPRHRLLKVWLDQAADIPADARALHFAAEGWVKDALNVAEYVTADINDLFDIQVDIENLDLPDARFDLILCNHVLEHVDDAKALSELYRVLSPGGLAVLTVPIIEGWDETFEDPAIQTPEERKLYFEDKLHVRFYGRDFRDRIRAAGFDLTEFTAEEPFVAKFALHRGEKLFLARKAL